MSLMAEFRTRTATLWHLQRVKRLVREVFAFGPHVVISVAEVPCPDADCPGPATRITVLGPDLTRRVIVIHRPASEISADDLCALSEAPIRNQGPDRALGRNA